MQFKEDRWQIAVAWNILKSKHNSIGGGGAEDSHQRCEFVGGVLDVLPQKILKSRGSGIFNILKFGILHPDKSSGTSDIIAINE